MSSSDDPVSEDDPVLTWHRAIAAVQGDLRDFRWNTEKQRPQYVRFTCAFEGDDIYTLEVADYRSDLIGRVSPVRLAEAVFVGSASPKVMRWVRSEISSGIPAGVANLGHADYTTNAFGTFMASAALLVAGQTRSAGTRPAHADASWLLQGWDITDRLQSLRRVVDKDFKNRITMIEKKLHRGPA